MFTWFCWHHWEYFSRPDAINGGRFRKCSKCDLGQRFNDFTVTYEPHPLPERVIKDTA